MSDPLSFPQLFNSPDLYLWQFDEHDAVFVRMDREAYRQSIFLDRRIRALSDELIRVPMAQMLRMYEQHETAKHRLHFIFHVAHCGSTLLSRALDLRDKNIVYREPVILRQIAIAYMDSPGDTELRRRLDLSLVMLGKSYKRNAPVLIKANVPVNSMLSELFAVAPATRGIALYSTLKEYLLAVLKTDDHRKWVGLVCNQLRPWLCTSVEITDSELDQLTNAEQAACLWFAQIRAFETICHQFSEVRTLSSATLFSKPEQVVGASFKLFGQKIKTHRVSEIANGELFRTYAKSHDRQRFDESKRVAEQKVLATQLHSELQSAVQWAERRQQTLNFPVRLSQSLFGESPVLIEA